MALTVAIFETHGLDLVSGVLYHRWQKYSLAEVSYRRALELEPENRNTASNLQMLQRAMKKEAAKT